MTDWDRDLSAALASGNHEFMRAMLARVPKAVLQRAIPYLDYLAEASKKDGKLEEALTYYSHLIQIRPDHLDWHAGRARVLLELGRFAEALADAKRVVELRPQSAVGYRLQAEAYTGLHELPPALAALRQVLRFEPDDEALKQHIRSLESNLHKEAMLRKTLDPDAPRESLQIELPPPPKITFDPALFDDPSIPPSFDSLRVEGLKQHLWHYSGQLSARNAITRLEDAAWLAAWDSALSTTTGSRVLFHGSELGVFALRALHHGAKHAVCVENFPLDARIATGMAHKQFLTLWHARHGAAVQSWSEEERRASFEEFSSCIDISAADTDLLNEGQYDCLVFPQIDHTLLGTGILASVRKYRANDRAAPLRVLPAKATIFSMGIQWVYAGADFRLEPMNRLRWSLYPQALDLEPEFWTALTEPVQVGNIDFARFTEAEWEIALPVITPGTLNAIVFWFELDLGNVGLSSAPGSELRCITPAAQHTDDLEVQSGQRVNVRVRAEESRLYFQTLPPMALPRARMLPSWYVPMLGDQRFNDAYRAAIARTLAANSAQVVLDIGAGCGLQAMMAARAGAERVVGCGIPPGILTEAKEIVALNGLNDRIALLDKSCGDMKIPDDLPQRAELAIFELFDCSLIGEGILHFLADAGEHLLTENARYLPAAAKIRAIVIEYRLDRILDIDANLLNPYRASPSFINVDATKLAYRTLTKPFDVFAFDFASASPEPQQKELIPLIIAPGMAGAVLFWFDLELDQSCWISNDPHGENALHWKQGLYFLPEVRVQPEGRLPLIASHNGSSLKFRWKQDVLPKESFSKVPRYDPRWLATSSKLEQQTSTLLQYCAQNPDEYIKVAEIAKRLAIDPSAHDLDPTVALRFASMFFGSNPILREAPHEPDQNDR